MEGAELGALARVFWGFPVLQILSFTVEQLDERTRPGRPAPRCLPSCRENGQDFLQSLLNRKQIRRIRGGGLSKWERGL